MRSRLEEVRHEVAAHREVVKSASTLDEAYQMESDHHDAMATLMADMAGMMSSMMDCHMNDDMMGDMDDADEHMTQMSVQASSHEATQRGQTDLLDCRIEEDTYSAGMEGHVGAMSADLDGFDGSWTCADGGMGWM